MAIKKIGLGLKSLFLLMIFLVISGLMSLIGKITSSKNSDSLIAQSGLINQARADYPSDCSCTESDGASAGSSGDGDGGGDGGGGCGCGSGCGV